MHALKKSILSILLGTLLPLSTFAVDDGTFTITIQGPEEEELVQAPTRQAPTRSPQRARAITPTRTNQVSATRARARAANNRQNTATTTQSTVATTTTAAPTPTNKVGLRTYTVKSGDTIWSVAHRYLPIDRSFNEFQIVASIYRHNPQAFASGNVNFLNKTTITIPDDKLIALESVQTGSTLLSRGVMQLPPLDETKLKEASTTQVTPPVATKTEVKANTKAKDDDLPVYEATETKIKRLQEEDARREQVELIPNDDPNAKAIPTENKNKIDEAGDDKLSDEKIKDAKAKDLLHDIKTDNYKADDVANAVDVNAVNIMLDETKKNIDNKMKVIETQLSEAIERMKKSSAATAKSASDSVSTLASQYDNIIAKIQQDIIEIKGNVAKLSKDNDRLREMLLANDEKIEDMQLQLSQLSITVPESSVDINRPILMIFFGVGILTLVMLILLIIFKNKERTNQKVLNDDFDLEDDSLNNDDPSLLSDENGSVEIEEAKGLDEEEVEANPNETKAATATDATAAAATATTVADTAKEQATETLQNDNPDLKDTTVDEAQEAWDNAAANKAEDTDNDKAVLDEWSQALSEQENNDNQNSVEVKADDDSVADAWKEALDEQASNENATDDATRKDSSTDDEDMAKAWEAALNAQNEGTNKADDEPSVSTEQEQMAKSFASALDDKAKEESKEESKDDLDILDTEPDFPTFDQKELQMPAEAEDTETKEPESLDIPDDKAKEQKAETPKVDDELFDAIAKSQNVNIGADDKEQQVDPQTDDTPIDLDNLDELLAQDDAKQSTDAPQEDTTAVDTDALIDEPSVASEPLETQSDNSTSDEVADLEDLAHDTQDSNEVEAKPTNTDSTAASDEDLANDPAFESLSGEEKAMLEALAKTSDTDSNDEEPTDKISDLEVEPIDNSNAEFEKAQDSSKHVGSTIDEVLNDDLNLEDLLTPSQTPSELEDEVPSDLLQDDDSHTIVEEPISETVVSDDTLDSTEDENHELQAQDLDSDTLVENQEQTPDATNTDEAYEHGDHDKTNPKDEIVAEDTDIEPQSKAQENASDDIVADDLAAMMGSARALDKAEDEPQAYEQDSQVKAINPETEIEPNIEAADDAQLENTKAQNSADTTEETSSWSVASDDYDVVLDNQNKQKSALQKELEQENAVTSATYNEVLADPALDIATEKKEALVADEPKLESVANVIDEPAEATADTTADVATQESIDEPLVDESAGNINQDSSDNKVSQDTATSVEQAALSPEEEADLRDLELRLGASKSEYDPHADEDIFNMLGGSKVAIDTEHSKDLSQDIDSMLPSKQETPSQSMSQAVISGGHVDKQSEVLEQVFDKIGPISAIDPLASDDNLDHDISINTESNHDSKEYQYYVDELNLARLYFETGDTEEAIKIIDDVKEHGSDELKEEANKILNSYGN